MCGFWMAKAPSMHHSDGTHLPYGGELCNMGQSYHAIWLAVHPSFQHHWHTSTVASATIAMQLQGCSAHHGYACTTIWCLGSLLCKKLSCVWTLTLSQSAAKLTRYTIVQGRHGQVRQMVIIRVECSNFLTIVIRNHQHIKWPQSVVSVSPPTQNPPSMPHTPPHCLQVI